MYIDGYPPGVAGAPKPKQATFCTLGMALQVAPPSVERMKASCAGWVSVPPDCKPPVKKRLLASPGTDSISELYAEKGVICPENTCVQVCPPLVDLYTPS